MDVDDVEEEYINVQPSLVRSRPQLRQSQFPMNRQCPGFKPNRGLTRRQLRDPWIAWPKAIRCLCAAALAIQGYPRDCPNSK